MPRKTEKLTTRQRQSLQIMREKTAQKRRDALRKKLQFISGIVLGVLVVGGGSLFYYSGRLHVAWEAATDQAYQATKHAGFAVRSLHIEGRSRTPMNEVLSALNVKKGDPILQHNLANMQERLQQIHSIREAAVERVLPDALFVRVVERDPVAVWQNQGQLSLVDDSGVVMDGIDVSAYKNLPLIVGEGAPKHVMELMHIMAVAPELAKEFGSAIRVGDRRWNIRLKNNMEVKLPEENAAEAWKTLVSLNENEQILARDIRVIDLRIAGKVFMKLAPELFQPPSGQAKET